MEVSSVLVLSIFLALFGGLLVVALVHLIQGIRYSGTTPAMATSSMLFLFGILTVSFVTWYALRSVDWSVPFTITLPFTRSSEPM